ncbi:MAG: hypothetical protein CNC06_04280 [Pelagibacterales bacterium MED-G40]|nr:MAG: hypothetical protein CNC06_04280 [Pelagibacterales bacterium MED-G40]|tara:strand:- start:18439 stop:18828 length:390 start_codon:yes stop_codon:yes gene_type:complete
MKIYGSGTDIIRIERVKKIIKTNKSFKNKIFSKSEIKLCEQRRNNYSCYASRFAAKEAFSKSLGTGISRGLSFKEIEIKNDKYGKPFIKVYGNSLKTVYKITKRKKFKTFLSISDDKPFAVAFVILTTL